MPQFFEINAPLGAAAQGLGFESRLFHFGLVAELRSAGQEGGYPYVSSLGYTSCLSMKPKFG
jgi:hypothetical protein